MSTLENIKFNDEGFLTDPTQWTEDVAVALAEKESIVLTDIHWTVLNFCRENATDSGLSPALRQIRKGTGLTTPELFKLFPQGTTKKIARISGLGKPEGCL